MRPNEECLELFFVSFSKLFSGSHNSFSIQYYDSIKTLAFHLFARGITVPPVHGYLFFSSFSFSYIRVTLFYSVIIFGSLIYCIIIQKMIRMSQRHKWQRDIALTAIKSTSTCIEIYFPHSLSCDVCQWQMDAACGMSKKSSHGKKRLREHNSERRKSILITASCGHS